MIKNNNRILGRFKEILYLGICFLPCLLAMHWFGITCPIKWLTGVSCFGCGMTRAWIQVLHGNIGMAFHYHPLWFLIIPAFFVFLIQDSLDSKIKKIIISVGIVIFFLVYLYRMTIPQNVVVFSYEDGIIFQLIKTVFNL